MEADSDIVLPVKYWEIVAEKLSAAGWSWGYCSAVTRDGWRWIVDAHREGRRYIVHSDELLSVLLDLEATVLWRLGGSRASRSWGVGIMGVDGPSNSNHEHLWLKYIAVDKKNLTLGWLGNGPVAQRLEQGTHNPLVPGSNPGGPKAFGNKPSSPPITSKAEPFGTVMSR